MIRSLATKHQLFGISIAIELLEDNTCTICQDTMTHPIQLDCGHVYCEECIFKWLIQQPHCPMCRKGVVKPKTFIGFDGVIRFFPLGFCY